MTTHLEETLRARPESAFVVAAAKTVGLTSIMAVPLAYAAAGTAGAAGAGLAVGLLIVAFGLSSAAHLFGAAFDRHLWMAITVGGLGIRVLLYIAAVQIFRGVDGLHELSLGLTAAAGLVLGQVLEMRALARSRSAVGESVTEGVDR